MGAMRNLWNGMSPCMSPGLDQCVVAWDAWTAIFGFVAVLITAFLGVVTYKLGKSANRASNLAVRIAGIGAERQAARDSAERMLVLIQITGEVAGNRAIIDLMVDHMSNAISETLFVKESKHRDEIFRCIERMGFPITESVMGRVHYLDKRTGACLVRAFGMFQLLKDSCSHREADETDHDLTVAHANIFETLPLISKDLELVRVECQKAAHDAGIADRAVATNALARAG